MLSLALARRIARPPLAAPAFARWNRNTSSRSSPSFSTGGEQEIYRKLSEKFKPSELHVEDVSGGCGTFYNIVIASEEFKGLNLVKQQRLVNQTLKDEIQGIHGLQLKTIVPR